MHLQVKGLADCQTGAEVLERYKAVRQRTKKWGLRRCIEIVDSSPRPVEIEVRHVEPPPDIIAEPMVCPTLATIMATVCRHYKVTKLDVISHRRHKDIMRPRQVFMALARHLTLNTLPQIGRYLGGRDHTTILHGIGKVEGLRKTYPAFDAEMRELERELGRR